MQQIGLAELVDEIPDKDAWIRVLIAGSPAGDVLCYGQALVGAEPPTWLGESWHYESVSFLSTTMPARELVRAFSKDAEERLRINDIDIILPRTQPTGQVEHRPSFALHDPAQTPLPSFEYRLSYAASPVGVAAGRTDFIIGPRSPSFRDLDSAYRGFFLGNYDAPANESVPNYLMDIRVLQEEAWIGPVHVRAAEMTVNVRGTNPAGATLEYFSPRCRARYRVDGPGAMTIPLPEGLPAKNTWLWLTADNSWYDYRALTAPWASDEQLQLAGVEREQTSRDEQAAIEAIVYGGEGPSVEFKRQLPEAGAKSDRMFKTIAAFANGAGGTVVVGVDRDELTVVGLSADTDRKTARDRIGQLIRTRILPTPDFEVKEYVVDGKGVFFVEVGAGAARPYGVILDVGSRDKPQFFVRRGASTYPAQPSDLNEILQQEVSTALTNAGGTRRWTIS